MGGRWRFGCTSSPVLTQLLLDAPLQIIVISRLHNKPLLCISPSSHIEGKQNQNINTQECSGLCQVLGCAPLFSSKRWQQILVCLTDVLAYFQFWTLVRLPAPQSIPPHVYGFTLSSLCLPALFASIFQELKVCWNWIVGLIEGFIFGDVAPREIYWIYLAFFLLFCDTYPVWLNISVENAKNYYAFRGGCVL